MVKIIYVLFIVVLCFILTTVRVTAADDTAKKTEEDVKLQTTILLDADVTTLRFILTNNSAKTIEVFPIMMNDNCIILTSPDGKKISFTLLSFGGKPNKKVTPNTIVSWDVNLYDGIYKFIEEVEVMKPGVYSIVWKVGQYTSNEVLCVKEEKK